ncbi:unnamed protein product [Vitrella brassicaformis CCMP3155]|uniref:Uncharacterized protein n=1 Tax=Vitrella brassicaformis (strain CCMP3155) TaxID=1169540 RepID=A0A0G4EEG2_VITBC|nr:unnamed protein product [Vitrella brassicaformis CCMP3155]|eukprot:CEL94383.1 unnamed protein product [Vitrella brassicaformis CCMP3155]
MRQYGLYGNRLGERMRLTRTTNGREMLGGYVQVTVHTEQTVPRRYRDRFNAADPPCEHYLGEEHGSFREVAIKRLASLSSHFVSDHWWDPPSPESDRIGALIDQPPPVWDGCRTIDYTSDYTTGGTRRLVILCGEEDGDDFMAHIEVHKRPHGSASIALYTTEAPQKIGSGPAVFPRAVDIARNKMRDAITVLPQVNEAINTAVGLAST